VFGSIARPRWARRLVGSPLFAALTAAFAAVVGLLGSVYQNEIASAFPLTLMGPFSGGVSWRAVVFWTALALLAYFVYLRQAADDDVRSQLVTTTSEAERVSRRIETHVQTLPPAAFQARLIDMAVKSHNWVSRGMPRMPQASAEELAAVIRGLLGSLASLALFYDDRPPTDDHAPIYSANVMVFIPNKPSTVPRSHRTIAGL